MTEPRTERELLIEAKEVIEHDSVYIAELKEAVAQHRPWLFEPGDKVLVLRDDVIYSGVVQQIRIPSPIFGHPDHIVQVALDKDENAPLLPAGWWHPDQVERIHA